MNALLTSQRGGSVDVRNVSEAKHSFFVQLFPRIQFVISDKEDIILMYTPTCA